MEKIVMTAEDTLCFHKGSPPRTQDRLVIQIEYGLRDYGLQHDRVRLSELKNLECTMANMEE